MHQGVTESFALIGAPNAGKTSVYSWITGSHSKSVNYPGSTVEYALGESLPLFGKTLEVVDTPGLYSLNAKSPEERVTVEMLFKAGSGKGSIPKTWLAVVDSTQLSRHLFLVKQLQKARFKLVVAVTMNDLLRKKNLKVNVEKLSRHLGVPVVLVDGRLGSGIKEVVEAVRAQMISEESKTEPFQSWPPQQVESVYQELGTIVSDVIEEIIPSAQAKAKPRADALTLSMDRWLLHPFFGLFFFVMILGSLFSSIYWLAAPLMDVIDQSFSFLGAFVSKQLPPGLFADFVSDGVFAGIGSVLVFVPQIFILFLGMVLLEDWGYLARAATIIDRPLSKIGLNGRSFVPLLSGFACAIPAMMAARTISNRRERLITIFIVPLMSCSARLPVYALLLGFLYQGSQAWLAGLALACLYLLSVLIGSVTAALVGKMLKLESPGWFMLELPAYRRPQWRGVLRSASQRTLSYIRNAGPVILLFSLIIWVITVFPRYEISDPSQRLSESYAAQLGHVIEPAMEPMGVDWRVGVGLISAFAAREVFVSSLALIFNVTDENEDTLQGSLLTNMKEAKRPDGSLLFTTASVWGLIVFFMIALQCLSTFAVSRRETGSSRFATIQLVSFTAFAYLASVIVVQGLRFFGVT
jgi:ferrous iron transport protein B